MEWKADFESLSLGCFVGVEDGSGVSALRFAIETVSQNIETIPQSMESKLNSRVTAATKKNLNIFVCGSNAANGSPTNLLVACAYF